jgi:hypothetical protein
MNNYIAFACWILGFLLIVQAVKIWEEDKYHQGFMAGVAEDAEIIGHLTQRILNLEVPNEALPSAPSTK